MPRVRIADLKIPPTMRAADELLDMRGGQREPIDVLVDGTLLDGWRRVKSLKADGHGVVVARIWESEQQWREWQGIGLEAMLRDLKPDLFAEDFGE